MYILVWCWERKQYKLPKSHLLVLTKYKNAWTFWLSNAYPGKLLNSRACSRVLVTVLLEISESCKRPKYSSIWKWLNKLWWYQTRNSMTGKNREGCLHVPTPNTHRRNGKLHRNAYEVSPTKQNCSHVHICKCIEK